MNIIIETIRPFEKEGLDNIICRAEITDNLNFRNAEEFKHVALALINGGIKRLLLDINNIKEIDSMGIGCFIILKKTIQSQNGDIAVVRYNNRIFTIFQQTKLTEMIRFFKEIDEGINFLSLI